MNVKQSQFYIAYCHNLILKLVWFGYNWSLDPSFQVISNS
jgi:hypothetical protein